MIMHDNEPQLNELQLSDNPRIGSWKLMSEIDNEVCKLRSSKVKPTKEVVSGLLFLFGECFAYSMYVASYTDAKSVPSSYTPPVTKEVLDGKYTLNDVLGQYDVVRSEFSTFFNPWNPEGVSCCLLMSFWVGERLKQILGE